MAKDFWSTPRAGAGGAGGAEIVEALPPIEDVSLGDQFIVEGEKTTYVVEEYMEEGEPGTLDDRALADSDFDEMFNSTISNNWRGALTAIPAEPAALIVDIYWLAGSAGVDGERYRVYFGGGADSQFSFQQGSFSDTGKTLIWIGHPDEADGFIEKHGDATTNTTEKLIELLDANPDLSAKANTLSNLVIYAKGDLGPYVVLLHTPGTVGGPALRYAILAGAKVVDELPDIEDVTENAQFIRKEDDTYHYVKGIVTAGEANGIVQRDFATADLDDDFFGDTPIWAGVVATGDPATLPPSGSRNLFYRVSDKSIRAQTSTGAISNPGLVRSNFAIAGVTPGNVFAIINLNSINAPDEILWDFANTQIKDWQDNENTTTDAVVALFAAPDFFAARLIEAIGAADELVFYYNADEDKLKVITSYVEGTEDTKELEYAGVGGAGGGGDTTVTEGSPDFFHAPLAEVTGVALDATTAVNVLSITEADVYVNRGGFTIEDGTNSLNSVKVSKAGHYHILASIYADSTTNPTRSVVFGEIVVIRADAVVETLSTAISQYYRNLPDGVLYLTGVHTIDLQVGDEIEFRLIEAINSSLVLTVGAEQSNITITRIVGTPTIVGGGGAGPEGFISPKNSYGAADVGKFLAENTLIKEVERTYHAGHGKLVGGTTTPGTWIELGSGTPPSADEGGGDGAHFRGWHHRTRQVTGEVTGDFVAIIATGDFEIFTDGTDPALGSRGWRGYNPFEAGSYWATITDSAGADFVVDGRGFTQVETLEEAFNQAENIGDAFTVRQTRQIVVNETVTHAEAEDTKYKAEVYYPPGTREPVGVFFGVGQTEEWPSDYPNTQTGISSRRMAFAADGPHDAWKGGHNFFDDIFVAAADVSSDIDVGSPAGATDNIVFTLPAGRYKIEVWWASSNTNADAELQLGLFEITSGIDDSVIGFATSNGAYTGSMLIEQIPAGLYVSRTILLDGDEQLYVAAAGVISDTTNTRHYMQISRIE